MTVFCMVKTTNPCQPWLTQTTIGIMWDFFFFFFVRTYLCERILHKKNFREALWWVSPWLGSEVFISECGLWARNGARVVSKSLKERETLHHLSSTQQSAARVSSKLWGNPVVSALLLQWNGKKKISWKAIFYLLWQIWPSSATKFPRCSLCNHMVQLLVKRGRYYVCVNIQLAYIRVKKIFPRVDFSLLWSSGMRRAGVPGLRTHYCNLIVKHRQYFSSFFSF